MNYSEEFEKACGHISQVKLVEIPSDFDQNTGQESITITLPGILSPAFMTAAWKPHFDQNPPLDVPYHYEINSIGGDVPVAESITDEMAKRPETALVDVAESAATAIAAAADNSYILDTGSMMFHAPRISANNVISRYPGNGGNAAMSILAQTTGKTDNFLKEDFRKAIDGLQATIDNNANNPQFNSRLPIFKYFITDFKSYEQLLTDSSDYLKAQYLKDNPQLGEDCASFLVEGDKDTRLTPEQSVAAGIIDAVKNTKYPDTMLVRPDDPRAQQIKPPAFSQF